MNKRSPAVVTGGVLYVLMGLILFLLTLNVFTVRWDLAGPLLVMGAGVMVLAGGVVRLRQGRRAHPARSGGTRVVRPWPRRGGVAKLDR